MVQNNENKEKKLEILRWVLEIQFDQLFGTLLRISLYGGYLKLLTSGPQKLFSSKLVLKNKNKELILKIEQMVLEIQCDKILFL